MADRFLRSSFTSLEEPKIYLVYLYSDTHVTREFCLRILTVVFHTEIEEAKRQVEEIRTRGETLCGAYTYEVAETKAAIVKKLATLEGFSIKCLIEEA